MTSAVPNVALIPPGPPAAPVTGPRPPADPATGPTPSGPSFADVLARQAAAAAGTATAAAPAPAPAQGAQAPTFSRHALERVSRRGIELDQATLQRLTGGVARAASKGSRDAVVLVDGTAFVVSVPSNTVITAVGSEHMRSHVFTNIDSAVIA